MPHGVRPITSLDVFDDPRSLPPDLLRRARSFESLYREHGEIAPCLADPRLAGLADELEAFLRSRELTGYHCTREPESGHFLRTGLRVLNHREHIAQVRTRIQSLATPALLRHYDERCAEWIRTVGARAAQGAVREGVLFLCMSLGGIREGAGVLNFFDYYGGEAVAWAFPDTAPRETELDRGWRRLLATFGAPVVVEVRVPGKDVQGTYSGDRLCTEPLARVAMSLVPGFAFANAFAVGVMTRDVTPEEIVRVHRVQAMRPDWEPIFGGDDDVD